MAAKGKGKAGELRDLPLTAIRPNADQPRRRMDEDGLRELADSIRQLGILEPILVAETHKGYTILAGERRWRAAEIAGLATIPALIVDFPDSTRPLISLAENLIREDLPPLDTARALQRLLEITGLKATALAKRLGMHPVTVNRFLRLFQLPQEVQEMLEDGAINMTQAWELEPIAEDREKCLELARLAGTYAISARKLGHIARRQEREKARATFAAALPSANGERPEPRLPPGGPDEDADPDVRLRRPREEILAEALDAGGTLEWSEAVKMFDLQVCHGSCGQYRYKDICAACPALFLVQALTKRLQAAAVPA